MKTGRADHSCLLFKGNIYVIGGMSYKENGINNEEIESLNSMEVYSIERDTWSELLPF